MPLEHMPNVLFLLCYGESRITFRPWSQRWAQVNLMSLIMGPGRQSHSYHTELHLCSPLLLHLCDDQDTVRASRSFTIYLYQCFVFEQTLYIILPSVICLFIILFINVLFYLKCVWNGLMRSHDHRHRGWIETEPWVSLTQFISIQLPCPNSPPS